MDGNFGFLQGAGLLMCGVMVVGVLLVIGFIRWLARRATGGTPLGGMGSGGSMGGGPVVRPQYDSPQVHTSGGFGSPGSAQGGFGGSSGGGSRTPNDGGAAPNRLSGGLFDLDDGAAGRPVSRVATPRVGGGFGRTGTGLRIGSRSSVNRTGSVRSSGGFGKR